MRSLARILLASSVLVTACSSESVPDEAADNEVNGATDICKTLDYGHSRPNTEHFLDFADDDAAMTYSKAFLAAVGKPAPLEISKDAKLLRLVDEAYAGFQRVFPKETEGFAKAPRIVIVDSEDVNAFAGFDDRPEVQKAPWLFFIHKSILARDLPEDALSGLFVHELAHLILRNTLPETRARIRTHYRQTSADLLGFLASDDAKIHEHADELRRLTDKVGRFSVTGGFPLGIFLQTEYQGTFSWFRSQRTGSPDPDACTASDATLKEVFQIVNGNASAEDFSLTLDARERADVKARFDKAKSEVARCYAHVKMPFWEAMARARLADLPPEQAEPILAQVLDPSTPEHASAMAQMLTEPIEKEIAAANAETKPVAIEQLLEVVTKLHERIDTLETTKELPIDELRVFDMEEDADDAAVRVLRAVGRDPLGNGRFLLSILKDPAACEREVESGKEPFYGRFVDPHNGTCWRFYHATKFANAIASCPADASAAAKRTPKGSYAPSRADRKASEVLEKGYGR